MERLFVKDNLNNGLNLDGPNEFFVSGKVLSNELFLICILLCRQSANELDNTNNDWG